MNLELYIAQLLYRHQCVIVPSFGAFLTEINTAFLNQSTHSFYPPRKVVSFNSNLKNNDGLLANHVSLSEKISYDAAVSAIATEVGQWHTILASNQKISLKNIGDISLNNASNTVFVPFENHNFLTSAFGLSTFVSPTIKREVLAQITPLEVAKIEVEDEKIIVLPTEKRSSYNYLKYAAALAIGLGGAGFFGYNFYENHIKTQTLLVEKAVEKQMQTKIQEATFFVSEPLPTVTLSVVEEKLSYHVVVGAFRNERNAVRVYKDLKQKGFDAKRIIANKYGLHPVLSGSYATREAANAAKAILQQNGNPDAWLLVEKL
jgi:CCDC81-like prokaryotic HU domain 2/CCDC81-like prokaryotic HU domain 1/SPOR domain